jgi:hypothetical protein
MEFIQLITVELKDMVHYNPSGKNSDAEEEKVSEKAINGIYNKELEEKD